MGSIIKTITLFLLPIFIYSQNKPGLTTKDYDRWETIRTQQLSPDGQWFAYVVRRVDKQSELRIQNTQSDSLKVIPNGVRPRFSVNSKWLSYFIEPSEEEKKKLREEKKQIISSAVLVNLQDDSNIQFEAIEQVNFDPTGSFIALQSSANNDEVGSDLIIHNMETAGRLVFGNVVMYEWSEQLSLLAMITETKSGSGNGVQLLDPVSGQLKSLDASGSKYMQIGWHEEKAHVAFLRSNDDEEAFEDKQHTLIAWKGVDGPNGTVTIFDPSTHNSFPDSFRVSEHQAPYWSEDGSQVYFGTQARKIVQETTDTTQNEDASISDVQVWHSEDLRIFPQQRSRHNRDSQRGYLCLWNLESDHFAQIGSDPFQELTILDGDQYAIESDNKPYPFGLKFGRYYEDNYLIDLNTSQRTLVSQQVRYNFEPGPSGEHLLYFKDNDYWVYNIAEESHTNITENINTSFVNEEFDYPVEQLPPYYIAGWDRSGENILIYDEFNIWKISVDGSTATNLTSNGRENVIYRFAGLGTGEEHIDLTQPFYCTMSGKYSKMSGFSIVRPDGSLTELIFDTQRHDRLSKADSSEVYIYRSQDFVNCPNITVTNEDFGTKRQITFLNAFQDSFAWGRSELIEYQSASGKDLQAALFYPANYTPDKKYPMIVYTYEMVSRFVNRYVTPTEQSLYNFTTYTSEGYFVLAPDIVYRAREPGQSAVESVTAAVEKVIDLGIINPDAVGLVGHSWGGYQATYIPTQTDIFAASVAGAPLTNFLSFMGAIHWNPGIPEVDHWETGQARMEVPFWEDFEAHVRNSPATFIHELETPMLMAFGDSDGVVDWHQGVEFYNFARRAGNKEFVLLVYPGEDHGIAGEAHRKDYNQRIREWFEHYLKGMPPAEWITSGITFEKRKQFLEENKKK